MRSLLVGTRAVAVLATAGALVVPAWRAAADVFTNVPKAAGYELVYTLNVPAAGGFNAGGVPYTADTPARVASIAKGSFDRVAYYMELGTTVGGPVQYVFASMDTFTNDVGRIGVPNQMTFHQRPVSNVNVVSNVSGVTTGSGLNGFNLEFWRNDYSRPNAFNVPNAAGGSTSERDYDWGDQRSTGGGYGSMQIHNNVGLHTVFAFNRWGTAQGQTDIGIGNNPGTRGKDWTFQQTGGSFAVKNIQVLVRPAATTPPLPRTLQILPVGDSITQGAGGTGGGYRTALQQKLAAVGIQAEFMGTLVNDTSSSLIAAGQTAHEGHSGWRIDQIDSLYAGGTALDSSLQPDYILLHIGTNDFGQNFNITTAKDRLDNLIGDLAAARPDAKIIVTNLMQRGEPQNTNIQTYFNPYVEGIVAAHQTAGEDVYFLDMRSAVPLSDMPDSLHPNQTGYGKMADAWFGSIMATVPEPTGLALAAVAGAACLTRRRRTLP